MPPRDYHPYGIDRRSTQRQPSDRSLAITRSTPRETPLPSTSSAKRRQVCVETLNQPE